jgi:hypothetical protein
MAKAPASPPHKNEKSFVDRDLKKTRDRLKPEFGDQVTNLAQPDAWHGHVRVLEDCFLHRCGSGSG